MTKKNQSAAGKSGAQGNTTRRESAERRRLASEAARLIGQGDEKSYQSAKLKAAQRLGVVDKRVLPTNEDIEAALLDYQALFGGTARHDILRSLRETALSAMNLFEDFSPRLVGAVLAGTADRHSDVHLHLFAETPEEVNWLLIDHKIPFKVSDKRYFLSPKQSAIFPIFSFVAGDTQINATVFPTNGIRQTVRVAADGQPIERASTAHLEDLLKSM